MREDFDYRPSVKDFVEYESTIDSVIDSLGNDEVDFLEGMKFKEVKVVEVMNLETPKKKVRHKKNYSMPKATKEEQEFLDKILSNNE